jgi:hypothetical protein
MCKPCDCDHPSGLCRGDLVAPAWRSFKLDFTKSDELFKFGIVARSLVMGSDGTIDYETPAGHRVQFAVLKGQELHVFARRVYVTADQDTQTTVTSVLVLV